MAGSYRSPGNEGKLKQEDTDVLVMAGIYRSPGSGRKFKNSW